MLALLLSSCGQLYQYKSKMKCGMLVLQDMIKIHSVLDLDLIFLTLTWYCIYIFLAARVAGINFTRKKILSDPNILLDDEYRLKI